MVDTVPLCKLLGSGPSLVELPCLTNMLYVANSDFWKAFYYFIKLLIPALVIQDYSISDVFA